jgi:hypothetical protein
MEQQISGAAGERLCALAGAVPSTPNAASDVRSGDHDDLLAG